MMAQNEKYWNYVSALLIYVAPFSVFYVKMCCTTTTINHNMMAQGLVITELNYEDPNEVESISAIYKTSMWSVINDPSNLFKAYYKWKQAKYLSVELAIIVAMWFDHLYYGIISALLIYVSIYLVFYVGILYYTMLMINNQDPMNKSNLEIYSQPNHNFIIVGKIEDKIVGFVSLQTSYIKTRDQRVGWISYGFVHPKYQNHGIGKKLGLELVNKALDKKYVKISGGTGSLQHRQIHLQKKYATKVRKSPHSFSGLSWLLKILHGFPIYEILFDYDYDTLVDINQNGLKKQN